MHFVKKVWIVELLSQRQIFIPESEHPKLLILFSMLSLPNVYNLHYLGSCILFTSFKFENKGFTAI